MASNWQCFLVTKTLLVYHIVKTWQRDVGLQEALREQRRERRRREKEAKKRRKEEEKRRKLYDSKSVKIQFIDNDILQVSISLNHFS